MSGQAFAIAAGLVGAIGAYTFMTQSESNPQAQGVKLKKTISEHAVAGAEKVLEPWSEKGHPMFGREMQQANGRDFAQK